MKTMRSSRLSPHISSHMKTFVFIYYRVNFLHFDNFRDRQITGNNIHDFALLLFFRFLDT